MSKKSRSVRDLSVGSMIAFSYPSHNYVGIPNDLELRRCRVLAVVDTLRNPIEKEWVNKRPTLNRGRWLVICEDLDKGEQRKFYWERMRDVEEIPAIESLRGMEYCVVENRRVSFASSRLGEVIAFQIGRNEGMICSVMHDKAS